jgi:hypothetical protein
MLVQVRECRYGSVGMLMQVCKSRRRVGICAYE